MIRRVRSAASRRSGGASSAIWVYTEMMKSDAAFPSAGVRGGGSAAMVSSALWS